MKRFWTALAVVSLAIFTVAGCNDYGNTFQGYTGAALSSLSPSTINACVPPPGGSCPDLTLMVNGSGFVAKTVVLWNSGKLKTTVTTDANGNVTMVTADVPASLIAKPGIASVQTLNPFSGAGNNGLSNPITFVINVAPNPVPAITSINPASATPGSGPLTLTITGTNFLPPPASNASAGSQVRWNTTTQTTLSLVSATSSSIQATVSAALLVNAGSATITVYNPPATDPNCQLNCSGSGGGSSNAMTFTITSAAAAKAITSSQVQEETPAVSQDGRYVAYTASQEGHSQIFVRDTCQSAEACQTRTILFSAARDGAAGNDDSHSPSLSSDGRYLAFSSSATNLLESAPQGRQVYLRDTCLGAAATCAPSIQLISTDPNGSLVGADSVLPSVSASGRFVAFLAVTPSHQQDRTPASGKSGPGAPNSGYRQVFVRDTCLGAVNCTPKTTRISLQPGDGLGSDSTPAGPSISGSAKHVALAAGNLATVFTRSVAVDDGVFLAITKDRP